MSADDAAVPDGRTGENGDAIAQPDVVPNSDGTGRNQGPLSRGRGRVAGICADAVAAVGVVADEDAAPAKQICPNRDAVDAGDMDVVGKAGGGADMDFGLETGGLTGCGVRGDGFQPKEIAGVEVRPQMQGGDAEDPRRTRGPEAGCAEAVGPETVAELPADGPQRVPRQVEPAVGGRCALKMRIDLRTSGMLFAPFRVARGVPR